MNWRTLVTKLKSTDMSNKDIYSKVLKIDSSISHDVFETELYSLA